MSFKSAPTFDLMSLFVRDEHIKSIFIFSLGEYFYGLPVEQVNQVLAFVKCNKVPGTPDYVLGVIDVRGDIVTLIDLNKKLKTKSAVSEMEKHDILLVEYQSEIVGLLVDRALALQRIPSGKITNELDSVTTKIDKSFLKGTASLEEDIINLINLDTILADYEKIEHKEDLSNLEITNPVNLSEEELAEYDLSIREEEKSTKDKKKSTKKSKKE